MILFCIDDHHCLLATKVCKRQSVDSQVSLRAILGKILMAVSREGRHGKLRVGRSGLLIFDPLPLAHSRQKKGGPLHPT